MISSSSEYRSIMGKDNALIIEFRKSITEVFRDYTITPELDKLIYITLHFVIAMDNIPSHRNERNVSIISFHISLYTKTNKNKKTK